MDFPFRDQFPTPWHLLVFADDDIREGRPGPDGKPLTVHDWQKDILLELGKPRPNNEKIRVMLLAANGSGKSQYVLAPFAVWMAMVHKESLTVITTSSGEQLDTQANRYIDRLCNSINQKFSEALGFDVFKCLYREFRANITKSFVDLFATDEKRKAEGRHPLRPGAEFAIIVDEAKTVDDGIYEALERCKGCTRRIEITSADDCKGYFYDTWNNPAYKAYRRKITAFDCPHITEEEIQETINKFGRDSAFVRSSIYSEFTSVQEDAVISRDVLSRCVRLASAPQYFGPLTAGLDLSAGGDETVMSVWHGNVEIGLHVCREKDTTKTRDIIIDWIREYRGKLEPQNIKGDDGGVGRSIIDMLAEKGYRIERVLNNHRAYDFTHYANRGTELWFNFKRFIEEYQVCFKLDSLGKMDEVLYSQLSHRFVRKQDNTKMVRLESKQEAKKQGHPSPDRADAVVLAWKGRVYPLPEITGTKPAQVVESPAELHERLSRELREKLRNEQMARLNGNTGQKVNPNVAADGTYKRVGGFSFRHSDLYPKESNSIIAKYANRNR